jgi:N4-gp56 family major capsid protein
VAFQLTNATIPELWSPALLQEIFYQTIAGSPNIVNRQYEGIIQKMGDRVKIASLDTVQIRNYTGAPIVYDAPVDSSRDLIIDQAKYFGVILDDVDDKQSAYNILLEKARVAGLRLAEEMDINIMTNMTTNATGVVDAGDFGGTAGSPFAPDTSSQGTGSTGSTLAGKTVWDCLLKAGMKLTRNKAPQKGRWAILTPEAVGALAADRRWLSAQDNLGESAFTNGIIGRAAGFDIVESALVGTTQAATGTNNSFVETPPVETNVQVLAGCNWATSVAEQIVETEKLRSQAVFGDLLRGLHVYGVKVVRPEMIMKLRLNTSGTA